MYRNFLELESLLLHAKFQDHRLLVLEQKIFKGFTIYGHGSHLGHVNWTIILIFVPPFPRRLHIKFGFDYSSGFRGKDILNC